MWSVLPKHHDFYRGLFSSLESQSKVCIHNVHVQLNICLYRSAFCFSFLFQFFITLGENLDYLDNTHTVFGEIGEGLDVLKKLNEAFCDKEHRPYKDIRYETNLEFDNTVEKFLK